MLLVEVKGPGRGTIRREGRKPSWSEMPHYLKIFVIWTEMDLLHLEIEHPISEVEEDGGTERPKLLRHILAP